MKNVPKSLLKSKYRKVMWKDSTEIIKNLAKVMPIKEVYAMGSFITKKKRPADVDFIIVMKSEKNKKETWTCDFVVMPDNKYGEKVLEDTQKWMNQKYGKKGNKLVRVL